MEVIVNCCAGLDVHQASVVACVNRTGRGGRWQGGSQLRHETRLCEWLLAAVVTQVAMETPRLWKPVYATLEHFEVTWQRHIKTCGRSLALGLDPIGAKIFA